MKADLHTHTTASDGTLTPTQLVALAASKSVGILAVTDHDSVAGVAEATAAACEYGIRIIPAVELSATDGILDIHLLAYFVDTADTGFLSFLSQLRDARQRRATTMLFTLQEAGYNIEVDDVLAIADGASIGRSHIGRALVAAGYAGNLSDAFGRLIGRGKPFYQPKDTKSPEDLVAQICTFGAIPVLAHPGITGADHLIESLVQVGLRGIEAYHSDHTPEQTLKYSQLADQMGLLVTGGSDYHGSETRHIELGGIPMPESILTRFLAAGNSLPKPVL
ncbi:MAG: PHP domain-containing protein [Coriobacteriia bacterium]|nr:PHP domain-containing protein [Coriobacteriia bacterium]